MSNQQELMQNESGALARSDVDPILVMIQSATRDPDTDVEKMERLFALYERQQEREAVKSFNRDFIRLQSALPEITEGGEIKHGGKIISEYARWDEDINPVIKPILAEHGFVLSFETDTRDGIHVVAHLIHSDGHSRSGSFTLPPDKSGAKNDVQSIGSSTSYAKRYAAGPLLNITTRGQDDDGNAAGNKTRYIDEGQLSDLLSLIHELGDKLDRRAFDNWLIKSQKVPGADLAKIPEAIYKDVVRMLERKRAS